MRPLRYFQVDAFTSELFKGNPAGVCILEDGWLPEDLMQRIAFENNQAETAFVAGDGIRWFTPTLEIDLCGHATLASAFVLFSECKRAGERIDFQSKSGPLGVTRRGELLELDFPSRPGRAEAPPNELLDALGAAPAKVFKSRDWMCIFEREEDIRRIQPNFELLSKVDKVIVTAPGEDVDFVSRFFAASAGVNEDSVTGSAHCTLIPYWAERLEKKTLRARQVSQRTGELFCEWRGDRVGIAGNAVLYSSGTLHV